MAARANAAAVASYAKQAEALKSVDFVLHIIPDSVVGAFVPPRRLSSRAPDRRHLAGAVLRHSVRLCADGAGRARPPLRELIDDMAHAVFGVIAIVMKAAPIGAFGAMAFTIGKFGPAALGNLIGLIATFYLTAALFVFVVLGIIARIVGFSIFRFLGYIKDELLIVLGTSSSESALPHLMEKLERLGCSKSVVGLVVPTGYSFNLDGTNIYMTLATLFIAQALGVDLSFGQQMTILLVAMLTSKGASGVTGAGLHHAGGDAGRGRSAAGARHGDRVLGIDKFMSECRALTNLSGNGVACVVVSWWEGELDHDKLHANLNKPIDPSDLETAVTTGLAGTNQPLAIVDVWTVAPIFGQTKTARFCRAVFSSLNSDCLFAVAEAPRPPSGAPGLGIGGCLGSPGSAGAGPAAGSGWLRLTITGAAAGWASTRKLTFSRTVERRRAARSASCAVSTSADARAGSCCARPHAVAQAVPQRIRAEPSAAMARMNFRREICNRAGRFRRRCRSELVCNRSNQTILGAAATAASTATSATAEAFARRSPRDRCEPRRAARGTLPRQVRLPRQSRRPPQPGVAASSAGISFSSRGAPPSRQLAGTACGRSAASPSPSPSRRGRRRRRRRRRRLPSSSSARSPPGSPGAASSRRSRGSTSSAIGRASGLKPRRSWRGPVPAGRARRGGRRRARARSRSRRRAARRRTSMVTMKP